MTCCESGFGPLVRAEKAACSRGLSRAWEAFIKMLMEAAFMTHFHGTGSPSLSCHSSAPRSACHNHHSLPPPPPSHNSLFRHSASISTFPCPGALSLSLSRSLSDPRCHKPSYILPRVTKLRDAGDKGSSSPGTGTRRITSLAVCLSLIFTPVGSQTVTPQPAMRAVMVFFFFSPLPPKHSQHGSQFFRTLHLHRPPTRSPRPPGAARASL